MKLTTKKLKQLVRETLAEAIHAEVAQKLSEKKLSSKERDDMSS